MNAQQLAEAVIDGAATDIRALRSVYLTAARQKGQHSDEYNALLAVVGELTAVLNSLNGARARV